VNRSAVLHLGGPVHLLPAYEGIVTGRIKVVRTTEWRNPGRTKELAALGFTGHRPPTALPSRSAIA